MSLVQLDHLAVSAATLEEGRVAVQAALGRALEPGGAHPAFGTHNMLMGLEDGLYLEVIAVDPSAPAPDRPRWFGLDSFSGPPRLTNWICRTDDLEAALALAPEGVGRPMELSRGDLRWRMAVPETGRLPLDDLFPALIEWQGDLHPRARLKDAGVRLRRLVLTSPEAGALARALAPLIDDSRIEIRRGGRPGIAAEFDTPLGPQWL